MSVKLYHELPGNFRIPTVGLGTSKFKSEEDFENGLDEALRIGYRLIDTAFVYRNEHLIGKVLKKWFDSGKLKREEIFVVTKLNFFCKAPIKVEGILKESLKRLQLDYVDLYLIHFPVFIDHNADTKEFKYQNVDHLELWKDLEKQVDAGRIRSLGVSNFNERQIARIINSNPKYPCVNNQIELHVYLQQKQLVKFCQENNITVTSFASLGSPGYNEFRQKMGRKTEKLPNILDNKTVQEISSKYNKTPSQILLRFLLQKDIIVIPKSTNPERLRQNLDLFNFNLDENEMKKLEDLDLGEDGRIYTHKNDFVGIEEHPEFPFDKN